MPFFPIAFALVLVAWHGSNRDRVIVGTLFAGGLVIAYLGLFVIYPMDHTLRMEMWDLILEYRAQRRQSVSWGFRRYTLP